MTNVRKIVNDIGAPCGCEITTDHKGHEMWTMMCIPHKKEFDMRRAAARESCSQVYRDRNLDLIA